MWLWVWNPIIADDIRGHYSVDYYLDTLMLTTLDNYGKTHISVDFSSHLSSLPPSLRRSLSLHRVCVFYDDTHRGSWAFILNAHTSLSLAVFCLSIKALARIHLPNTTPTPHPSPLNTATQWQVTESEPHPHFTRSRFTSHDLHLPDTAVLLRSWCNKV